MPLVPVVPCWDQDQDRTSQLLGDLPCAPHLMYQVYQARPAFPPWGGLRMFPWVGLPLPLIKVLRAEVGMPAHLVRA